MTSNLVICCYVAWKDRNLFPFQLAHCHYSDNMGRLINVLQFWSIQICEYTDMCPHSGSNTAATSIKNSSLAPNMHFYFKSLKAINYYPLALGIKE